MKTIHEIPTPSTIREAEAALQALKPLAGARGRSRRTIRIKAEDGTRSHPVTVPAPAFHLLMEALAELARGNAVSLLSVRSELTTQQAADLLNVSRPFLVKLLEAGLIPYRRVGSHRRVRASDLLAYKQKDDARRRESLNALAEEAQRLRLGY